MFDANLILKGEYSSALVEVDQSDAVADSVSVANSDGNLIVDLKKTGLKGLACVVIFTAISGTAPYDDELVIEIQESDHLDREWQTNVTFPTVHNYVRKIWVTATTAFVAADQTTPRALTETTSTDSGQILYIGQNLFTIGGTDYILVEMDDSGDLFDEAVGTVETATGGTGVGTKAKDTEIPPQFVPGTMIRRFTTDKRYVRAKCTADDGIGTVWILLMDDALVDL